MTTLADAIGAASSYLLEMGYTVYSLKISSFDAMSEPGVCAVSGTFQDGFMGEYHKFDIVYEPDTGAARSVNVVEISTRLA